MAVTKAAISPAAQRRIRTIQAHLLVARTDAKKSQDLLAKHVGVTDRSLRDWERGYDQPSMSHAITWAYCLGYRFILKDDLGRVEYAPSLLWESDWQMQEYRRWASLLKARRRELKLSQTDLGRIIGITRSTLQRWEDGAQMPRLGLMIMWVEKLDFFFDLTKMEH